MKELKTYHLGVVPVVPWLPSEISTHYSGWSTQQNLSEKNTKNVSFRQVETKKKKPNECYKRNLYFLPATALTGQTMWLPQSARFELCVLILQCISSFFPSSVQQIDNWLKSQHKYHRFIKMHRSYHNSTGSRSQQKK